MTSNSPQESLGGLLSRFSAQISDLFRAEIALAKAQLKESLSRFAVAVVLLAVSAVLGFLMLLWLSLAMCMGLLQLSQNIWVGVFGTAGILALLVLILVGIALVLVKAATKQIPSPQDGIKTNVEIIKSAWKTQPGEGESND